MFEEQNVYTELNIMQYIYISKHHMACIVISCLYYALSMYDFLICLYYLIEIKQPQKEY